MTLPEAETFCYLGIKQGNVTQRSKPSGKHTFTIQNDLTFQSTNDVLPISEDPRAFLFSWLLLALYP